jgi:hypothetical protein
MTTNPQGPLSAAQQNLRSLLADCEQFRLWTGQPSQDLALGRIFVEGLPPPADDRESHAREELDGLRPNVIVSMARERGFLRVRDGFGAWKDSGRLLLQFEQALPAELADDRAEADRRFENTIGLILDEMCRLSDQAGQAESYLVIERLQILEGPFRTHPDEIATYGDVQAIDVLVEY